MSALKEHLEQVNLKAGSDLALSVQFDASRRKASDEMHKSIEDFAEILGDSLITDLVVQLEMKLCQLKDQQIQGKNKRVK